MPSMNEAQEKRALLQAFNQLTKSRSKGYLFMAVSLWRINGLQCALEFIAKMKAYDKAEGGNTDNV